MKTRELLPERANSGNQIFKVPLTPYKVKNGFQRVSDDLGICVAEKRLLSLMNIYCIFKMIVIL